ncbi:MAG: hypothetical protein ABIE07_08130, partial [Candidatus Zixiibacteriota bacterium]
KLLNLTFQFTWKIVMLKLDDCVTSSATARFTEVIETTVSRIRKIDLACLLRNFYESCAIIITFNSVKICLNYDYFVPDLCRIEVKTNK